MWPKFWFVAGIYSIIIKYIMFMNVRRYISVVALFYFMSESSRRMVCLVSEYFQYRVLNTIRYMHFPIPQSPINATLFHTIGLDLQYD